MPVRLGELLVRKGLIDSGQLKKALEAQLIYGSHIGTCLIELGYLDEEQLGAALAEASQCRYAPSEMFDSIPGDVIETIPARLVEKHKAIPFHKMGKILHVAMVEPGNVDALDELQFASGHKIRPWIAPEIRIYQAMERYYDVPRKVRYITLYRRLDEVKARRDEGGTRPPTALSAAAAAAPDDAWSRAAATARKPRRDPVDSLADLSERFCQADDADQLIAAALDRTSPAIPRCLFFTVKSGTASLRQTRGWSPPEGKEQPRFVVTEEPLFSLLYETSHFRGPLPDEPRFRSFYESLGLSMPAEILLFPIYCHDQLVGLFYGDAGNDFGLHGETDHYDRIMKKLSLALSIVLLKKKLRSI